MNLLAAVFSDPALVEKILAALVGFAAPKFFVWLYGLITDALFAHANFTISGVWCATFESYGGKKNVEFVHFVQKKEMVKFKLQHYSTLGEPREYNGEGVLRGSLLSAVYFAANRKDVQSGVFSVVTYRLGDGRTVLSGKYAELNVGGDNQIVSGKDQYTFYRVQLPHFKAFKLRYGFWCFENYDEAIKAVPKP